MTLCPRCGRDVPDGEFYCMCDVCVREVRDDAAINGGVIASRFDPDADHRSPAERRRED